LLDTSVVLELLRVPFESDRYEEAVNGLEARQAAGTQLQLPAAAILETGAHIFRIANGHHRRECAARFHRMIKSTIGRELPWTFTLLQWDEALLEELAESSDDRLQAMHLYLAKQQLEMGDLLILTEFRRIRANLDRRVVDVDVWTYDNDLRSTVDVILA